MTRRRPLSSQLFRAARVADDVEAVESGKPRKAPGQLVGGRPGACKGRGPRHIRAATWHPYH